MYEYISTIIVTFVFFFGIFIYFAVIISGSKHEKEAHDFSTMKMEQKKSLLIQKI